MALAPVALFFAVSLRYGMTAPWEPVSRSVPVFVLVALAAPVVALALSVHRIKLQNLELRAIGRLGAAAAILAVIAVVASYMLRTGTPRSVPVIFGAVYFVMILAARSGVLGTLSLIRDLTGGRAPVVIYGAGSEGVQIATALRASDTLRPVAFVDDNAALQGLQIAGLRVHHPADLARCAARHEGVRVVLAIPHLDAPRRETIAAGLRDQGLDVLMLPSHAELLGGGTIEKKLRPVRPDELLGRDKVDLDVPAVAKAYAGRVVMVTGAGGSIGSELCRQLLDCHPSRIVLFEHSEFALYEIDRELRALCPAGSEIDIRTRLGSVTNAARVASVMAEDAVEFVLHAAAYKHVPLVEENELEGARNNVLGTRIVAEAAIAAGVERFVLVSTDKAVRPTNIMGATKRLAELVVQDLQSRSGGTRLAMVRFGNVLGSSGSVLPLFQKQIEQGGPVTVTHPEVTRFFMTIPEAARLVLLAGAFARGGDVFVLNMGQPMRIVEIARRMIELSGREVRSDAHPDGIGIEITGLRPGEKLYEELLIDDDGLIATPHRKILRAEEESLSQIETAAMLREISGAVEAGDTARLRAGIHHYVRGYHIPAAVAAQA